MKRMSLTALGSSAALCLSLTPSAAGAVTAPAGGLRLKLIGVPTSATRVLVELESPLNVPGAPKKIVLYPLASVPATGTSMTVVAPTSRLLRSVAAVQHGTVNLLVDALSATRSYPVFTPAHVNPSGASTVSVEHMSRVSTRRLPNVRPDAYCVYDILRGPFEVTSRIGELHVATQQGVSGYYNIGQTADNTISVGVSFSEGSNWSVDGNITLTNSLGTNGGFGETDGFLDYVDGHIYYAEYYAIDWPNSTCAWEYVTEATYSVGDAFPGDHAPGINPYGRCYLDPYGYATVAAGDGHWNADRSTAWYYQGITTVFGFSFGGSSGFTSVVNEGWDNNGPNETDVCGNKYPVQDSTIFYDGDL